MIPKDDTLSAPSTNPLPTLQVTLGSGTISAWNEEAERLFGSGLLSRRTVAAILTSPAPDFAVFLEAVQYYGRYIDAFLDFQTYAGTPLRLQTFGIRTSDGLSVLLSFLDLDAQDARNARAEERAHQREGLWHWQRIYGFFKELEANNHLILEAAGEGIYGINAEGKATFINRAAQEMLGWNADDLIGRDLHNIIHHSHLDGSHFPSHTCPIYNTFRRDQTMRVDDDAFWRKDGRPILVEYVSTPIYDHGVLAGAVIIFRDVTERRENEQKLRDALAEVEKLRHELEQENAYLLTEIRGSRPMSGLIGCSPPTRNLEAQVSLVADTGTNVLITGPAGSGKSLLVTAIHEGSARRKRPVVRVNCSDLSASHIAQDFFGYRKGAFPGAMRDTVGKIGLAANGTLHLDEVSDLPRDFQAQLLEVIQTGIYRRIGDDTEIEVTLRIISTTTRDLAAEVQAGRFRQDLFFALNVFPMRCEPLRNRSQDIPHLAQHFLERAVERLKLPTATLSKANVEDLQRHGWPGNVSELHNVIERAAILSRGGKLRFEFQESEAKESSEIMTHQDLKTLERKNLIRCMRRAGGKVAGKRGAASLIGLPATTVYSRLKALKIAEMDWI